MTDTVYVKLIDGQPQEPPVNKGNIINYNLNIELLLADGYKPLVPAEVPPETEIRMYHYEYEETETTVNELIVFDETTEEAEARIAKQERERLDQLNRTKREVFLALYTDKGITPEQIRSQITDESALIEFDYSERFWRGNPLINQIGLTLGYTTEQLDCLFEYGSFVPPNEE